MNIIEKINQRVVEILSLGAEHKIDLMKRGFDEQTIIRNEYCTVNSFELKRLMQVLRKEFSDVALTQHPAVKSINGCLEFQTFNGLLIPLRTKFEHIHGFQVRTKDPDNKYKAFSAGKASKGKWNSHIHYPLQKKGLAKESNFDYSLLPEGPLKGDRCASSGLFDDCLIISFTGIANWKKAAKESLSLILPVKLAFDQDYRTNPNVLRAYEMCLVYLCDNATDFEVLRWASEHKGIDDAITGGSQISSMSPKQAIDDIAEHARKLGIELINIEHDRRIFRYLEVIRTDPSEALNPIFIESLKAIKARSLSAYWKIYEKLRQMNAPLQQIRSAVSSAVVSIDNMGEIGKGESDDITPLYIAERYLERTGDVFVHSDPMLFVSTSRNYERVSESLLEKKVLSFCAEEGFENEAVRAFAKNVIANLGAVFKFERHKNPPFLLNKNDSFENTDLKTIICLRNGLLLDVNEREKTPKLIPHTKDLFITRGFDFNYNPEAKCPKFVAFLNSILPDKAEREFVLEWMGYCLFPGNEFQKCLFLVGDGANGKSVFTGVLELLLGKKNVSSVGMEAFHPNSRFGLCTTVDKLANIANEIGHHDKVCEANFKKYVACDQMTIEEKNVPAFEITPTAKLIFATNTLPSFSDSSSGTWRRIHIVKFGQTFSEDQQNRDYLKDSFWEEELSGIFNLALDAYIRLQERGRFDEPESCKELVKQYELDMNFPRSWLVENCEADLKGITSSKGLYTQYKGNSIDSGTRPVCAKSFAKEVAKVFPSASKTKNAVALPNNQRGIAWLGIRLKF